MQEVDFASLTARETAPVPTSSECGADMELYMQDCRRVLALGIKRWGGDAPGRLGQRVLNPDEPRCRALRRDGWVSCGYGFVGPIQVM